MQDIIDNDDISLPRLIGILLRVIATLVVCALYPSSRGERS